MAPSASKSSSFDLIQEVAAHVPDLVVNESLSREAPYVEECNGVLLYADISGFNELVECMISTCQKRYGADQLTRTLNKYISEVINHVLKSGGDILYFTGWLSLSIPAIELIALRFSSSCSSLTVIANSAYQ
ncbi:adenylate cyclase type 10-like [Rhinatrema bivittatum]|uniref:adenylate cyclase type 10-like n=1 Tax=Rhinatrema bivittatum TaxID=194408 RepID=UPI00112ECC5C|nr:adenylate cyclase type 10-like [Rhinatrema bivittatum]